MTTLPARQLGVDPARLDPGDAGAAVAAVGGDPGLRPGQADGRHAEAVERHRQRGSRSGARRSRGGRRARADPGSSVIAAARPSSSSVVSPIADTTTTRSLPAARSRAIRRATRLIRSASATDEPPNFWTTRGAGWVDIGRGILPAGSRPAPPPHDGRGAVDAPMHTDAIDPRRHSRCASTSTAARRSRRSPVARSTSERLDAHAPTTATASRAFRARAARPERGRRS